MMIRIKRRLLKQIELSFLILLVFALSLLGLSFSGYEVMGLNISNQTVIARVNISNTAPDLYMVAITSPTNPIDLTANGVTIVVCNGSIYDGNGYTDIVNISATLYFNASSSVAVDDNNTHYTNSSCGNCSAVVGTGNLNGSCLCQFSVQYYANPGLWSCNMSINDSGGLIDFENSTTYTFNELLGIAVESNVIDYGNMSVTQTSNFVRENVTNTGNIPINFSVRGYGGDNESIGQNVTMICESGANITFGYQRYYFDNATLFANMFNLTNQSRQVTNITIPKRTLNNAIGNSSNSTYWKLQIPPNSAGICNGSIIFKAVDASD